jgi:hypothetical protein
MAIKVFLLYNNHKGYTTIAANQFFRCFSALAVYGYRIRPKEAGDWILRKKT